MNNEDYTTFVINLINVLSFAIGIQNLELNDKQVTSLDNHLSNQDGQYQLIINKLDEILNKLNKILTKGENNGRTYGQSE